jgi:hypothetical protein
VFASTGGLTGIEVGIAGGTSVLSQKLLEAVFGDQAVRTLTARARDDLRERVRGLLDDEAERYLALLQAVEPPLGAADALREAAGTISTHRTALPPGAHAPGTGDSGGSAEAGGGGA